MYLVKITYSVPLEEIEQHVPAHRDWLMDNARAGRFVVAGPLEDRTGGLILASFSNRAELDAVLAQDAYHKHQVAGYEVMSFNALLRAADFPAHWAAPDAKAA